jgi:polyketide biosynthesis 3-hydroxy-3-methylglutaryl-CoA synthase-like enzyme PksG
MTVGIEAMNVFGGSAFLDVTALARHRKLDMQRFDNLMMKQKALALPYEDGVSYGVNAARPVLDALAPAERERIELVITCTESGIDFGKSMSTYIHHYLGLGRNCRLFEIKQACYSVTAGLQMAASFILSGTSPGAKALVIGTDISRFLAAEGGDGLTEDWSYAEPSAGAGAVAMLVSDTPRVLQLDVGANGYYGYEVMDTCRPIPDSEAGDADLSLMSYLDCSEKSFLEYRKRVSDVDYRETFQYLVFHTPFGGMVKGAHRAMMRKMARADPATAEADFRQRVMPGLGYCQRVGNIMGATVYMALASTIDNAVIDAPKRIGIFSYGSGCCSEFYSGVVTREAQEHQRQFRIKQRLDERYELSMEEYESIVRSSGVVRFGTRNVKLDTDMVPGVRKALSGTKALVLREINGFHREYEWIG